MSNDVNNKDDCCSNPECKHPLERHDLHWRGCKYCWCDRLPSEGVKQLYANTCHEALALFERHGPPEGVPAVVWQGMLMGLNEFANFMPEYFDEYN